MGQVVLKCLEEISGYSFNAKWNVEHSWFILRGTDGLHVSPVPRSAKCLQLCISTIAGVWQRSYDAADPKNHSSITTRLGPNHFVGYGAQDQGSSMGSETLQEYQRANEPQEIGGMERDNDL